MKRPKRIKNPLNYAAGYTLHLYCDRDIPYYWEHQSNEPFYAESFKACAKEARRKGWVIRLRDRTATCPVCTGKRSNEKLLKEHEAYVALHKA